MANAVDDGGMRALARALVKAAGAAALVKAAGVAALAVLGGCASSAPPGLDANAALGGRNVPLELIAEDFRPLPGWGTDDHAHALNAFHQTCAWADRQAADKAMGSDPRAGRVADWRPACHAARALPSDDHEAARLFFEAHFTPVTVAAPGDDGLFTGYYEVELQGSWTPSERFSVPLYRPPPRARKGLPSRARIAEGALAGKGLEILWVDDAIGAFFLEIQGSGRVRMPDGSLVGLSYAGQNGHRYYPIGRHLLDLGVATPEEMSLQYIRRWLEANPEQAQALMNLNPSYVFFKLRPGGGARGARDMELTPGRSLAVDPSYVPLGIPLWMELRGAPVPGGDLRRLVVAQDTGGAIKGAVRGDLFWGAGRDAELGAGTMRARGRYTLLVPRQTVQTAQRP